MWVLLYLAGVLALLLSAQTVVLLAFREPLQWTFGANSTQPKSLKLTLKVILQATLIGSIFVFPVLVGSTPAAYYAPVLPLDRWPLFLYGEVIAIALMAVIFGTELVFGWIGWKIVWPVKKTLGKCLRSALSSLTVVAVEEPFFRAIILQYLLFATAPGAAAAPGLSPWLALPLGAAVFSLAHYIRKVRTYWPAVGLGVLGLWLGVAYYCTGSLWLSMGLHSGGILAIGVHRCFTTYRGRELLVGTQTFPIAGAVSIAVMLVGTVITWFLFRP